MILSRQKKSLLSIGIITIVCFAIAFTVSYAYFLMVRPTYAAQKEDWKAGNIIDDNNFTNVNSMSVSDIQSFLDQKIGTCDVWGTGKATEYGSSQTRAQYAASRGWQAPPYTCLNKYYEVPKTNPGGNLPANNYSSPDTIPNGAQSAAWIIKDAAVRYNISPRVLLVKIATESVGPLTSDNWPLFSQYRYAMGSHCPDSGPNGSANCDSNYAGFSIQIYSAAQLMRWYLDSMDQPWWSYKKPYQTNSIMWNVAERGCGSGNVYIESKATAALYTYTPYQPNQAALNNLYGRGDNCSAYGNRNFWRVYVDWFGLPSQKPYQWQEISRVFYTDNTKQTIVDQNQVRQGQYLYVQYRVKNTGSSTWKQGDVRLGKSDNVASSFYTEGWISGNRAATILESEVQPGQTGTIEFWIRAPTQPGQYTEYYNLVIENVTWFVDIGSYWSATVNGSSSRTSLNSQSRVLKRGDILQSPDSQSILSLTPYGSLKLYTSGKEIWDSGASNVYQLVFQQDGNLVAYDKLGHPLWVKNGTSTSSLSLTNTQLVFGDSTSTFWSNPISNQQLSASSDNLATNDLLFRGQTIWSSTGNYRLTLQSDGNLVYYGPSGAVWATNIPKALYLAQQSDGNLVAYDNNGAPVWSSSRSGTNVRTFVQNDGNIVSYGDKGPIWASRQ